jgi:hypothetical protein
LVLLTCFLLLPFFLLLLLFAFFAFWCNVVATLAVVALAVQLRCNPCSYAATRRQGRAQKPQDEVIACFAKQKAKTKKNKRSYPKKFKKK